VPTVAALIQDGGYVEVARVDGAVIYEPVAELS
jgi:hypothetical protein